jgi:hypothetical protein
MLNVMFICEKNERMENGAQPELEEPVLSAQGRWRNVHLLEAFKISRIELGFLMNFNE